MGCAPNSGVNAFRAEPPGRVGAGGGAGMSGPPRGRKKKKKKPLGCETRRPLSPRGPEVSWPLPASGRPPGSRHQRWEGRAHAGAPRCPPPPPCAAAPAETPAQPGVCPPHFTPSCPGPFPAGSGSSDRKASPLCTALAQGPAGSGPGSPGDHAEGGPSLTSDWF